MLKTEEDIMNQRRVEEMVGVKSPDLEGIKIAEEAVDEAEEADDERVEVIKTTSVKPTVSEKTRLELHGIKEEDIELVMNQAGASREDTIEALIQNQRDVVNSIMSLTD